MTDREQKYTGTVEKWLDLKGYGFVRVDNDTQSLFVHARSLRERSRDRVTLHPGQRVEFSVGQDELGRARAIDVVVLDAVST